MDRLTAVPDPLWRGLAATSPDVQAPRTSSGVQTFPARVPIVAGDYLAIEFGSDRRQHPDLRRRASSARPSRFTGAARCLTDGSPFTANHTGAELVLRARVEPDSDADGFGDETQDNCPGQAGVNAGCKAKKKCKRKGKKKSAAAKKKKGCKKRRKKRK